MIEVTIDSSKYIFICLHLVLCEPNYQEFVESGLIHGQYTSEFISVVLEKLNC